MAQDPGNPPRPDDSNRSIPDAPTSAVDAVAQVAPPARESGVGPIDEALDAFLSSRRTDEGMGYVRRILVRKLYWNRRKQDIDDDLINELLQQTCIRALEAARRRPAWTRWSIPGWVKRLTHRTVYWYFHDREDDDENLAPDVDPADLGGSHAFPRPDEGARAHFICKYLEPLIGDDPVRIETFRLMCKHALDGFSVEELAREAGTTPNALSLRIFKLRKELGPKISIMDDEKKRMLVLVPFWGAAFVVLAILVAWLLGWLTPAPPVHALPPPAPTASVAPAPTFDQAFPPDAAAPAREDGGSNDFLDNRKGPRAGRKNGP